MMTTSRKTEASPAGQPAAARLHKHRLRKEIFRSRQYYLLLLPAVIYVLIFCYGPMYGLIIGFKNYKVSLGVQGSLWVGLRNFRDFFNGPYFWSLMKNTFILSFCMLVFSFPIPIIVALVINELQGRYKRIVQTVLYAPHFISIVVLIGIINVMFSPSMGVVNTLLNKMGVDSVYFMGQPNWFRPLYIGSGIWQNMGWDAVVFIAALSAVDPTLHEAAALDGASRMQRVIHINLRTILPTVIIMLIMQLGRVATVSYEKVYLMQNDLNMSVSEVISTYVYKRGLIQNNYSFATAVGLFNNVVNVVMLCIANMTAKRFSETSLF